ncbi:MAG: excinuclease ABC subunit UvrC [Thermodesulfobacteriota bacterium]
MSEAQVLDKLKEKALALPESPGVYLLKDASGRVIYVGKAKNLPKRVSSYFQKNPASRRTALMVSQTSDLDCLVTDNEKEALILENSLIKKNKPRYNVILRDDKTYPSLRLTVQEEFPRLEVVRRIKKDGAVYFGPFSSATAMRQTLRLIRRLFPLRQCRRPEVKTMTRPCLNHQLGRCLGPCGDHVSPREYRSVVEEVILFFKGRNKVLTETLGRRMKEAAARLDFEAAASLRDRLAAVERTLEKQKVVSPEEKDQDVIGLARERGQALVVILFIRQGALLGSRSVSLGGAAGSPAELVESLLVQYYGRDNFIPDEILVPYQLEGAASVQEWLDEKKGQGVALARAERGPRKKLLDLARENAALALVERLRATDLGGEALNELQDKLALFGPPRRIEGFDMSTWRGEAAVGAMVVLEDGKWVKSDYRRYKIKSASGQDDYAMMSEVLGRRLVREDIGRPDLMLLDGGRGQLGAAQAVIADLGIKDPPPLVGLAKGREGESDKVWLPGRKNPVEFRSDSPGLLLLMRVRDEAHRYVQAFHHRVHAKKETRSLLDDVPGVGPARRKILLKHFGSIEAIENATLEQLAAVPGLPKPAAESLYKYFRDQG